MGLFGKLMFWRKKDEFEGIGLGEKGFKPNMDFGLGPDLGAGADFGQGFGQGLQQPGLQQPSYPTPPSFQQQPSFQQMQPPFPPPSYSQPAMQSPREYATDKNLEVISSKLDALRAALESINQRLANLEAIARGEEDQRYKRRW
ncbi:hypothetical protein J4458_00895 [Candidatus Woesearchaeota archaeon]|nr:hypothetical protein [Candidatus Woesearchaeota archaeon]